MSSSYETDAVAWSDEQAHCLRTRQWDKLDIQNIAEEIEGLGHKYRDALRSQIRRLLLHRLQQQFQPLLATQSWNLSLREASKIIRRLLRDHPSLKSTLQESLETCYQDAREDTADEIGISVSTFPEQCPADLADEINGFVQ